MAVDINTVDHVSLGKDSVSDRGSVKRVSRNHFKKLRSEFCKCGGELPPLVAEALDRQSCGCEVDKRSCGCFTHDNPGIRWKEHARKQAGLFCEILMADSR